MTKVFILCLRVLPVYCIQYKRHEYWCFVIYTRECFSIVILFHLFAPRVRCKEHFPLSSALSMHPYQNSLAMTQYISHIIYNNIRIFNEWKSVTLARISRLGPKHRLNIILFAFFSSPFGTLQLFEQSIRNRTVKILTTLNICPKLFVCKARKFI